MKKHAIIGFNHGVLGLAENPALGPGFFRQNTSGYAFGVLTPKASPSGWVFSQAQHAMIKTYINRPVSQMRATLGGLSRTSGKLWQDYLNCYMFWT